MQRPNRLALLTCLGSALVLTAQSGHAQAQPAPEAKSPASEQEPAGQPVRAAPPDAPPTPPTATFPPTAEPSPPSSTSEPDDAARPPQRPASSTPSPETTGPPETTPPAAPLWQPPIYRVDPERREPPPSGSAGPAGRREGMPSDFVARPLTLPRGTFELSFANSAVFIDAAEHVGWVPGFALGITPELELGLHAPLRHDAGEGEWTTLDPLPHLAFTWLDQAESELGTRAAVLIPASSDAASHLELAGLGLWHVSEDLRVDFGVELELGFEKPMGGSVRVPVAASFQVSPWFYAGLQAAPDIGLVGRRDTGMDAFLLLGLTIRSYERAQLDLTARVFVENAGAGDGQFSDGAGTVLTVAVYPELY